MNTSPFTDKQITGLADLMNPQVPSYDFQPIRTVGSSSSAVDLSSSTNLDEFARNSRGSVDSKIDSATRRYSNILEPHDLANVSRGKERDAYDVVTVAEVDRIVKKYADNLLHALEGVGSRVSQLERRTRHLESSIDDLKDTFGNNSGSTDGKLRQLENILREVQTGVQVLHDKQEIAQAKLQQSSSNEDRYKPPPPPPTESSNAAGGPPPPQQPHQFPTPNAPPPQPPQPPPPQFPPPPSHQNPPPQFPQPRESAYFPPPQLPPQAQHYQLPQYPHQQMAPPPPPMEESATYTAPPPAQSYPPNVRPPQYYGSSFPDTYPYSVGGGGGGGSPSHYNNAMMNPSPFTNSPPSRSNSSNYSRLPMAKVLPQAAPIGGPSSGSGNRVPVDDVVDKVATMGFSREQVRATVRRLTENGQAVDLNVVLDKLMNG